ncbi:Crp/Fnr family transcriptional regulator [Falsirhodobacter sp. 20TX0035]|uniref:Crp/Fnr family transcriptional regulator n=1 Tax=Falsirhodobacter sp. 20TX0035 TaxID=3022019 RepID=UPI00232B7748|nr:Crp/Fnr family transcriptional regulator [Falsirhodobacter sp. 20TX0035]MDB6453097.1 Crp/Fnr family transcriptional regulator [Falsirhodobacter sp. 20TX0035]
MRADIVTESAASRWLPGPSGQNNLLRTLPDRLQGVIEPHLELGRLDLRTVLEVPNERPRHVFFPLDGVGSMLAVDKGDLRLESGLFGREGMTGLSIVTGGDRAVAEASVQVPGRALRMEADQLADLLLRHPGLRQHFLLFVHAMLMQITQTALSNGQSTIERRLSRWLLMCHDRTAEDRLALTHEFLSIMLGVRRAGVTVATHLLEGKGLIRAERGEITILDRAGLEAEAGASYGLPEAEYARLFGGR